MDVSRGNKEKFNNSYQNNYMGKGLSDDNLSEKANSVQTSYKYQKNRNGPNTISSKDSYRNHHDHYNNPDDDDDLSYEISENSNLIIMKKSIDSTIMGCMIGIEIVKEI